MWPGSQPLGAESPRVQVLPVQIPTARLDASSLPHEGLPTAAVLTALLVKYLHVNGVNATLDSTDAAAVQYTLQCTVPRLTYEVGQGHPATRSYQAELDCLLGEAATQQTVWKRSLTQRYDKEVWVDWMTRRPAVLHEDDRIMYRECLVPLWDAMAQSVGTVLISRQQASLAGSRNVPQGSTER